MGFINSLKFKLLSNGNELVLTSSDGSLSENITFAAQKDAITLQSLAWSQQIVQLWKSNDIEVTLVELGKRVSEELLGAEGIHIIRECLRRYPHAPLMTHQEIEIEGITDAWIPWELLHIGDENNVEGFLGHERNIYRIPEPTPNLGEKVWSPREDLYIESLFDSIQEDKLGVERELKILEAKLGKHQCIDREHFAIGYMGSQDIVHIMSLIFPVKVEELEESLILGDDFFISSNTLANYRRLGRNPLVVFNIRDNDARNPYHVFRYARLFLKRGASAFVASEFPLPHALAVDFSEHFYERLIQNASRSLGEVLLETKKELLAHHQGFWAMLYAPYFKPKSKIQALKVLFCAANPAKTDQLNLDKEFRKVSGALQEGDNCNLLQRWKVTPNDLQDAIIEEKPHILHFTGHGQEGNPDMAQLAENIGWEMHDGSGIILHNDSGEKQIVSQEALSNMFQKICENVDIRLVFLSACYSEPQAEAISRYVPYVIGMSDAVSYETATQFSERFYDFLIVRDYNPEEAFSHAQISLSMNEHRDRSVVVLYRRGQKISP